MPQIIDNTQSKIHSTLWRIRMSVYLILGLSVLFVLAWALTPTGKSELYYFAGWVLCHISPTYFLDKPGFIGNAARWYLTLAGGHYDMTTMPLKFALAGSFAGLLLAVAVFTPLFKRHVKHDALPEQEAVSKPWGKS
ncbi:hypothetical protein THIX_60465 [Thiomonas sp. X19]|uniref:hypothetical protein n=1 Tax=Thiomonas sp. X19 TaxID=1050370 RepID=UPI000B69AFBA|nr:hypothetical protein [Thiomonas sp. X19]SCC94407.1 hypothetical protein THIX_60465 [Thiomonas sp. X19]